MKKINILLIDDDPDDQLFFRDALAETKIDAVCTIVNNGLEALEVLAKPPYPDIVFLDLNMPLMNGLDCLENIKKQDNLKNIPVIIFTTTSDNATMQKCSDLGAVAYLKKPNSYSDFLLRLKSLLQSDLSRQMMPTDNSN